MIEIEEETKPRLFGVRRTSLNTTYSSSLGLLPLNTQAIRYPEDILIQYPDRKQGIGGCQPYTHLLPDPWHSLQYSFLALGKQQPGRAGGGKFFRKPDGWIPDNMWENIWQTTKVVLVLKY